MAISDEKSDQFEIGLFDVATKYGGSASSMVVLVLVTVSSESEFSWGHDPLFLVLSQYIPPVTECIAKPSGHYVPTSAMDGILVKIYRVPLLRLLPTTPKT